MKTIILVLIFSVAGSCSIDSLYRMQQKRKVFDYDQVDMKSMVNRYVGKDWPSYGTLEGIYSVSSLVVKKGKGLLAKEEKEKVVERKEGFTTVAIIRETGNAKGEFLELSLEKEYLPSYSVVGLFSKASEANLLIYQKLNKKGSGTAYTLTFDKNYDLLEGVRTENTDNFTYTYKLTYIKISPKQKQSN